MKRRDLILGSAALLAGCGGGGSKTSSGPGRAVFTVEWPKSTTRLIPAASQSLAVEIRQNGTLLTRQALARPGTTLTFADLPEGDLTAFAAAYPTTDGTGVPQASGTVPLAIVDGQTVQVPLTMASAIASFAVSPATLGIGETRRLTATAKDASGATILIPSSQLATQIIGGAENAAFDPIFRNLTGVSAGNVTVRATDPESGVTRDVLIQIGAPAPALPATVILPYMDFVEADQTRYLLWTAPRGVASLQALDPDSGNLLYETSAPGSAKQILLSTDNTVLYFLTQASDLYAFRFSDLSWKFLFNAPITSIFSNIPSQPDSLLVRQNGAVAVLDSGIVRGNTGGGAVADFDCTYLVTLIPTTTNGSNSRYDISSTGVNLGLFQSPLSHFPVFADLNYVYTASPSKILKKSDLTVFSNSTNTQNYNILRYSKDKFSSSTYGFTQPGSNIFVFKFEGSPLTERAFQAINYTTTNVASRISYLGNRRLMVVLDIQSGVEQKHLLICNTP